MFRFTIRDVLWLTVVVALGLSWWITWARSKNELKEARRAAVEAKLDARLWEGQAMGLAEQMRIAGWQVEVTRSKVSLQWPNFAAYKQWLKWSEHGPASIPLPANQGDPTPLNRP